MNALVHSSIPSPSISSFDIGPLRVHIYALCILTGIVIATWLSSKRLSSRGGKPGMVLDIAMWTVPIGIVGGRLYHVVTHPTDYFFPGADLWKVLFVWEGGLAIFGSILFGSIGAYIGCRRAGIRFLSFADALAPGLLLAQAFGRFGNFFNHELYGAPTTLPWGLEIEPTNAAFPAGLPAGTLFQPLFLYEMIWNTLGVLLLLFVLERRFNLRWGKALGFYLLWYGTGRAFLESLRLDPTEFYFLGLKINTDIALLVAVAGIVLIISQARRHPGPETSIYLTPQASVVAGAPSAEA
ncbi:prolipoprotein diacylglyceryl transferase [Cryobacterium sp. MP_M5]|uniref:prolipoprotein diacylglyceryl transferase n=1 Tax=Cryobacterium sp. MP_M3 TaxID=2787716 RepID=UPI0027DDF966|nr:prolipoprotein diacylglyceryl transferase [Cryobacterium sp. MP_M3]MEC5176624.1 prolipoprotein diacylglyceryl transferase [Cryobacterium sp. MP_M5]